ncbi:protein POLR1D-like [Ischnura elegans]|uniref:protein POLR1D-like n=1 Tax=Ischnura elegans TaxID=197161 RepID=UPI001ED8B2F4|nr:protein POLR1D-like [Ischnura elegans]
MEEDTDLDRLAEAELLLEAKRGLARSNVYGPTGWKRCPLPGPNKKFLQNTIINAVSSNKFRERKSRVKHGRDHRSHRRDCHMNQKSESQTDEHSVKKKVEQVKNEKIMSLTFQPKETDSIPKQLTLDTPPERSTSSFNE